MLALQDAVKLISSERVTERQMGIEQYKLIFSDNETLIKIGQDEEGEKKWLRLLQALFNCVIADRTTCVRRGQWQSAAPTSKKRLQDSASMVLWMLERCNVYLESTAVVSVINHLTQMLDFRGELIEIISVYYLKALSTLLSHEPHVDHLELDLWRLSTSLCFNVILHETLSDDPDYTETLQIVSKAAKRSIGEKSRRTRPEDLESAKCIYSLLRSAHAPLIEKERQGAIALLRYAHVLIEYSQESSLHLPVLRGITHLLSELSLNDTESLLKFADLAWFNLLALWSSRNQDVKEQVVLAFRTLLPVLQHANRINYMDSLCEEILGEGNDRLSLQPLQLTHLDLRHNVHLEPFKYHHFQASYRIEESCLLSWSTLELGADLIAYLVESHASNGTVEEDVPTPSKRRKLRGTSIVIERGQVLKQLLSPLVSQPSFSSAKIAWHTQLLLFLISRCFHHLQRTSQDRILSVITEALARGHSDVSSWFFLALTAATHFEAFEVFAKQVFQSASRQIMREPTSRSAAHVMQTMLSNGMVERSEVLGTLSSISSEMDVQSIHSVSDATCTFFTESLSFIQSSLGTATPILYDKVFTWLRQAWVLPQSLSIQRRSVGLFQDLSCNDIARIILATCRHPDFKIDEPHLHLPMCPTSKWMYVHQTQREIERYILFGEITEAANNSPVTKASNPGQGSEHLGGKGWRNPNQWEIRGITYLANMVNMMVVMLKETNSSSTVLIFEQYRDMIELARSGILIHSYLQDEYVKVGKELVQSSFHLLDVCLSAAFSSQLSNKHKAAVIQLVSNDFSERETLQSYKAIQPPGRQSGVHREQIFEAIDFRQSHLSVTHQTLKKLWSTEEALPIINTIQRVLHSMTDARGQGNVNQSMEAYDMFEDSLQMSNGLMGSNEVLSEDQKEICISCIKILFPVCMARLRNDASPYNTLIKWVDKAPTDHFLHTCSTMFTLLRRNRFSLNGELQEKIIERIGSDVLASYQYERDTEGHLVGINFLQVTMSSWLARSAIISKKSDKAIQLCLFFMRQFNKYHMHWTAEYEFANFMEQFIGTISKEDEEVQESLPKLLRLRTTMKNLCMLNGRPDMRIRYYASSLVARLFDVWVTYLGDTDELYTHQESSLPRTKEDLSQMASRILSLANICVASAQVRAYAFFHLLEVCISMKEYIPLGIIAVQSVSHLLGYPDARKFWLSFANQLVSAMISREYIVDQMPYAVLGYSSNEDWAEDSFLDAAAPLVGMEEVPYRRAFSTLCKYVKISEQEGIKRCMPVLIALRSINLVVEDPSPSNARLQLVKWVNQLIHSVNSDKVLDSQLSVFLDRVVVEILVRWYEPNREATQAQIVERCPTFGDLISPYNVEHLHNTIFQPPEPRANTSQIHACLTALARNLQDATSLETTYNVIHQLGSIIYEDHSLNDQLRHLYALQVYIAMTWSTTSTSPIIIRLILQICLACLQKQDLVAINAPLICVCIQHASADVYNFPKTVVSISEKLYKYTLSHDSEVVRVSLVLLDQIEGLLERHLEQDSMRYSIRMILCAWPRQIPKTLSNALGPLSSEDLVSCVHHVKVINVHLLQRLSMVHQRKDEAQASDISKTILWKIAGLLKDIDSITDEMKRELLTSFANIAQQYDGELQTPSVQALQSPLETDSLIKKARAIVQMDENNKILPLHQWLTTFFIGKVHSVNLSEAEHAIYTLRRMFEQQPSFNGVKKQNGFSAALFSEELRLITSFPPSTLSAKACRDTRLIDHRAKEKSKDLIQWSQWLCLSLLQQLRDLDSSLPYWHMMSFVEKLSENAVELLPCIVHIFYRVSSQSKFVKASKLLSSHLNDILQYEEADHEVWKVIIKIVLQLREDPLDPSPFSGNNWIEKLNWMLLASRAVKVELYASALLFLELHWHDSPTDEKRGKDRSSLDLQYAIYSNIEDPDSFYGVRNDNVRDSLERRLEHEGRWDRAFSVQSAEYEASGSNAARSKMTSTLHHLHLSRVAKEIGKEEDRIDYEMGWRKQDWDLPIQRGQELSNASKGIYTALRALHQDRDLRVAQEAISYSLSSQYQNIAQINVESSTGANRAVRNLLGMYEIQQWGRKEAESLALDSKSQVDFETFELLSSVRLSLLQGERKGDQSQGLLGRNFMDLENAIEKESTILIALAERAREEGKVQIAVNSITQAQHLMRNIEDETKVYKVEEEFANVLWMQGDHSIATDALYTLMKKTPEDGTQVRRIRTAQALTRLGQWRAIARSHQARLVAKECFRPALRLLDEIKPSHEFTDVAYKYAVFADEQYRELSSSREARELEKAVGLRQEEIRQLELEMGKYNSSARKGSRYVALHHANVKANAILKIDMAALADHDQSKDFFRRDAVEMFARELSLSDKRNDGALMRLTALWFENARNESFNAKLAPLLKRIPSWKFLPIVRQICSRLNKKNSSTQQPTSNRSSSAAFQSTVFDTVLRMAKDHPFHALYPLYALYRGSKGEGEEVQTRKRGSRSSLTMAPSQSGCSDTAFEIIERVRHTSKHGERISAWQNVCEACVEWAQLYLPTAMPKEFGPKANENKEKVKTQPRIPSHLRIHKIRDVDVPIITKQLQIDPTGKYSSFVSIVRYHDRFSTAGGVHLPKITECIGSDGKIYKQLFKDRDDLRQDAVMQQVFTLVNDLLKQDRRARQRSLHVRTYSVVPLGPQYGLLEFVGSTLPLLLPLRQLYARHHVEGQLTPVKAREEIMRCQGKSIDEKRAKFEEVCSKMPPIFRFYFLQMYTNPMALLQSRLNYTRSVATSSIVGHILGLGDRHSSNILLDQQTGEVIHIDFGVAFDQGRLLPIPELVPFRLTRNIVDGMGLNGVEGVFRCGCEETLRVLRSGASVIKTVLEVFRYDPLYDWTQNPIKVIQAQGYEDGNDEYDEIQNGENDDTVGVNRNAQGNLISSTISDRTNTTTSVSVSNGNGGNGKHQNKEVAEMLAERAINSTMEKLSDNLSVEYTVNALMHRAMDPANLGAIFHGWQAAL